VAATLVPGVRWYTVLQHASTVVGLAAVSVTIARWVRRQPPEVQRFRDGQALRRVAVAALMLGAATLGAVLNARRAATGMASSLGLAAVGAMAALAIVLFVYGVIVAACEGPSRVG
jgi:hypothetical protein